MRQLTISFSPRQRDRIYSTLNDLGITALVEGTPDGSLARTGDTVTCYLEPEQSEQIEISLQRIFHADPAFHIAGAALADTDWASAWKEFWKPLEVTKQLWISPTWCEFKNPPGCRTIWIDTTTAFGTGTHETTRLCLKLIEDHFNPAVHHSFLDIGCGSGILSIYAALLGSAAVTAIDIDPQAVETAALNAGKNSCPQIAFMAGRADRLTVRAAFVAANILSGVIKESWPAIRRSVEPGGLLLLSGILTAELDQLLAAIKATPIRSLTEGEWCAVLLQPHSDRPNV